MSGTLNGIHLENTGASIVIHPTAIVEEPTAVGESTSIWHHCHVREGATVGRHCTLGKNVFVDQGATVGDYAKIQNNVSIYRGVTINDRVFVGPSAVFTNDLRPRAASRDWAVVPTLVESDASIGANATIVCGTTIGRFAMVAAGAVVTRDVQPHQLVAGNPARHVGWVCDCGVTVSRQPQPPTTFCCPACASKK